MKYSDVENDWSLRWFHFILDNLDKKKLGTIYLKIQI